MPGSTRPLHGSAARPARGFTLIEMMIVMAVLGILAAIAYPSYQSQIRKAQRTEAKTALMRAAERLERSMTQNAFYPNTAAALSTLYGLASGTTIQSDPDDPTSSRGRFRIVYAPGAGNAPVEYTLTAQPNPNAIADSECPSFGIDSRGRRLVNGSVVATTSNCWK